MAWKLYEMRILLVEDNLALAELLVARLQKRKIAADSTCTLEDASAYLHAGEYDALILDLGLPDGDGIDWLQSLPAERPPVLILTARGSLSERILGLDTGADDYLVKPAEVDEIAARLRAIVRRPGQREAVILSHGPVSLRPDTREVMIAGETVPLSVRETDLLEILLRRAGQVAPRELIEGLLYGVDDIVTPNALEALASRLRKHLAEAGEPDLLHTVRGVGYLLESRGAE